MQNITDRKIKQMKMKISLKNLNNEYSPYKDYGLLSPCKSEQKNEYPINSL
jgi:hypothetical protein